MNNFKSIIIPIIIGLFVAVVVMAFKAPTANPPNSAGQVIYSDSSGNVGIGTNAPGAKLHIVTTTEQLRLGYNVSNFVSFITGSAGQLTITPSGSATTTISGPVILAGTSGNVGIGTTTPAQKLEVVGGIIKATGGLIIETRTSSDPTSPATGQIWLRTDL